MYYRARITTWLAIPLQEKRGHYFPIYSSSRKSGKGSLNKLVFHFFAPGHFVCYQRMPDNMFCYK